MAPRAADPQPLVKITLKKQWQLATSAPRRFQLPKAGWKLGAVWLWGRCQTVGAQRARAPLTSAMAAGAEVMARNKDGWSPLHNAAWWGIPQNVQALLEAGADAQAKDKSGKTLRDLAHENEKLEDTDSYWALFKEAIISKTLLKSTLRNSPF